jgi:hypothetical protein
MAAVDEPIGIVARFVLFRGSRRRERKSTSLPSAHIVLRRDVQIAEVDLIPDWFLGWRNEVAPVLMTGCTLRWQPAARQRSVGEAAGVRVDQLGLGGPNRALCSLPLPSRPRSVVPVVSAVVRAARIPRYPTGAKKADGFAFHDRVIRGEEERYLLAGTLLSD